MALTLRLVKGSEITAQENDDNFTHVLDRTNHSGEQAISTVTGLQTALNLLAPLSSPTFTGTPTAPTPTSGTSTTQLATCAFVMGEVTGLATVASSGSYTDLADKPTIPGTEEVQDIVGAMFAAGTQTGATVSYDDPTGSISITVGAGLVDDTAYAGTWDAVTGVAPSKNAVYDKIEALDAAKADVGHAHVLADISDAGTAAGNNTEDFATAFQGGLADSAIQSNTTQAGGGTAVTNGVQITQAEYDAIGTPDANTVYWITG